MPTEADLVEGEIALRRLAGQIEVLFNQAHGELLDQPLIGGVLTADLFNVADRVRDLLRNRADEVAELADECARRARLSAELHGERRRYLRSLDDYYNDVYRWRLADAAHREEPTLVPPPGPFPARPIEPPPPPPWWE